jgi:hypothetical protein
MLLYIDVDLERNVSCFADIAYPTSNFKFQLLVIKIVTFMSMKFLSDTRHIFLTCHPPIHITETDWSDWGKISNHIRLEIKISNHITSAISYRITLMFLGAMLSYTHNQRVIDTKIICTSFYILSLIPFAGDQRRDFKVPNSAKWSKA